MTLGLHPNSLSALMRAPRDPVQGRLNGIGYSARIVIPDYGACLNRHYQQNPDQLDLPFEFRHFGLVLAFQEPIEIRVHDDERVLDEGLRRLVARFGPVVFQNARLPDIERANGQRNVFQSLSFHIDRGPTQADHYSLFWRDPFDPVQRVPRTSSTLVLANAAAYLQALQEGQGEHEFKLLYHLFGAEEIGPLIGEVLVELGWRAPEGTGEVAIIDNRTVLHASYHPKPDHKGYPIAVRYLF